MRRILLQEGDTSVEALYPSNLSVEHPVALQCVMDDGTTTTIGLSADEAVALGTYLYNAGRDALEEADQRG